MFPPRLFTVLFLLFPLTLSCASVELAQPVLTRAFTHIPKEATVERLVWMHRSDTDVRFQALKEISLESLLLEGPPISVLVFFGGAHGSEDRLWCGDSQNEIALWRRLASAFSPDTARVLGIACPPAYGNSGYGKARSRFLDEPEGSNKPFLAVHEFFTKRTQEMLQKAGDPFAELLFDLRFRMLLNRGEELPRGRAVRDWEGYFKAPGDRQTYGLPTIWILSRDGEAMCEPFWGNNYPDKIRYRYEDVAEAIEKAIKMLESRRVQP